MVPQPVSHPSAAELCALRAILAELAAEALATGHASGSFHGYRLAAACLAHTGTPRCVDLLVEYAGLRGPLLEHAWGTVAAPSSVMSLSVSARHCGKLTRIGCR
jgi:hypothetical protein